MVDAVAKLQVLLRIPTVSHPDPAQRDPAPFVAFTAAFEQAFPRLVATLEQVEVGGHALLFRWPGRSTGRPVVLMAHIDVVPVEDPDAWRHPPFGGEVHDGVVWGRGTLDDKGQLVAVAEAVERLLEQGFVPAQDVWLSFGSTEEVSGETAGLAVETLRDRGVTPWFVLDEGGAIASGALPGIDVPLGVVGVTEKGVTNLELRADGRGGHASTPSSDDATFRLVRAVRRLNRAHTPSTVPGPTLELLRRIAPHAPAPLRQVFLHADRVVPAVARALVLAGPESAAMTRTTFAVTTLSGSPAVNVIAATARAGVNVRIMVGDTVASVLEHVRRTIRDDAITVTVTEVGEPSPVSPHDDDAFRLLEATIAAVFPDAVPTPYVMMAATDSRFFTAICGRVYRFAPFRMTRAQRQSIHAADEHLGVADLLDGIAFYERLLRTLD